MLSLAPTCRRLRTRQLTLADGTVLTVQARVPTRHEESAEVAILDDFDYAEVPTSPDSALPTIPSDNFDPSI